MPTNTRTVLLNYNEEIINVLATEDGLRSPRMLTLDNSYFQVNAVNNGKVILPGMCCSKAATGGRIFPVSRATVATTTAQNTLTVKNAYIFKVGDTLRIGFAGGSIGTIASINIMTNVITLAANAVTAVAIRDVVTATDGGNIADVYGMNLSANDVVKNPNDIGLYTSCTVYGNRLPVWTPELTVKFPEITFFVPISDANLP